MPVSIAEAQKNFLAKGGLNSLGEGKLPDVKLGVMEATLAEYGKEFLLVLGKVANAKGVVASGELLKRATIRIVGGNTLQIIVPDYYDFPNEGVQGVNSSKNAPGSPYKFKNYGMNEEGRANIKKYIQSGHAKIETVKKSKDKALGIGREKKHLSLADSQAEQLIFMIKKYGIKKTNYFTDALNETFKDFEVKMSQALERDIVFTLEKLNRK